MIITKNYQERFPLRLIVHCARRVVWEQEERKGQISSVTVEVPLAQ